MATPIVYHTDDYLRTASQYSTPVRKSQITANTNDWALGTDPVCEVESDASRNVTGIAAPAAADVKVLYNRGASNIVLKHSNAGSAAANRIVTPDGNDYTLASGGFVPLFYATGDALWVVGTVVSKLGFKVRLTENTLGVLLLLNLRYWSIKHLGYATDGTTANTGRLYYRPGLVVPTASFAASSAATRESLPILDGEDEIVLPSSPDGALFLLAATADLMVACRPNEGGGGLNR